MSNVMDLEPEAQVVGAVMSETGSLGDLADLLAMLKPDDFFAPWHGSIWSAAARLVDEGRKPTVASVKVLLDQEGVRYDPVKLFDLTSGAPVVAAAGWFARLVVVAAGKRAIANAAAKLGQLAQSTSDDIEMIREEARRAVDDACTAQSVSEARSIAQIVPDVLDVAQHGRAKVLPTGWDKLDHVIGGLAPGRVVVVGARPAVGKSLMGTNLALQFAGTHDHAVLISSLEMDDLEVGQRLLANHSRVRLTGLAEGSVEEREWDELARTSQALADMPITVVDASDQTVTSIRRHARDIQRKRGDLALIVVDYLQLLEAPVRKGGNRAEALAEVSRGLKKLARETGACVVAMAQVNREGARNSDGRPRMHDLRESGAIEADADVVILLHRTEEDREVSELEAIVEKNRHGVDGVTVKLAVEGHIARLSSSYWSPSRGIA